MIISLEHHKQIFSIFKFYVNLMGKKNIRLSTGSNHVFVCFLVKMCKYFLPACHLSTWLSWNSVSPNPSLCVISDRNHSGSLLEMWERKESLSITVSTGCFCRQEADRTSQWWPEALNIPCVLLLLVQLIPTDWLTAQPVTSLPFSA